MDLSDAKCCASQSTVPGRGCPHLKEHKEAISQNYKSVVNYIKSYKSNTSDRAKVWICKLDHEFKIQLCKNSIITTGSNP